ncbi:hypothetical protein EFY87_05330 [Flexivirga caeni]|uniref:Cation/H+ exchanger transmembrane domain-containing protein n=1 Tax=Flexivirga caeni TaxID=2294115 RepID=A0A3M9MFQ7_9MICO|nr:hypothetical protein EFY87_05330 [Flexivirga caeni]
MAVTAALTGTFSWMTTTGRFALTTAGGLPVGAGVAFLIQRVRPWLRDPLTADAVSLAAPFATYLLAEKIHGSGVLAVVTAGLVIGHNAGREETGAARLQTGAVWQLVEFILEGFVFLLIGQQLPDVLRALRPVPVGTLVTATIITVGVHYRRRRARGASVLAGRHTARPQLAPRPAGSHRRRERRGHRPACATRSVPSWPPPCTRDWRRGQIASTRVGPHWRSSKMARSPGPRTTRRPCGRVALSSILSAAGATVASCPMRAGARCGESWTMKNAPCSHNERNPTNTWKHGGPRRDPATFVVSYREGRPR